MTTSIPCNDIYGATYDMYKFGQSDCDVFVIVPLPPETASRNVKVTISSTYLSVSLQNPSINTSVTILEGQLHKPIKCSESMWCIQDKQELLITLVKLNLQYEEWWPCVIQGEKELDMKMFAPPPGKVEDFDEEGRAAVARLIHDQSVKRSNNYE